MRFVVVDTAGTIPQADLVAYAAAQQRQLREHYAACFDGDGASDEVRAASSPNEIYCDEFPLKIEPVAPNDGELGVHDVDAAHVYLDLLAKFGGDWRTTMSHEALEARHDRRLHGCVELDDGTIVDTEVCDRVEAEWYMIDGVPMSNFNTPECFEPPPGWQQIVTASPHPIAGVFAQTWSAERGAGLFDWMGSSRMPNQVRPGGYAQLLDPANGWMLIGEMSAYRAELARRGLSRGALRRSRRIPLPATGKDRTSTTVQLGERGRVTIAIEIKAAR